MERGNEMKGRQMKLNEVIIRLLMSDYDQPISQLLLAKGSARLVHIWVFSPFLRVCIRLEYTLN